MKERPILFSGAMVNAILEGRKTQTRRVMKYQPSRVEIDPNWHERISGNKGDYVGSTHPFEGSRPMQWYFFDGAYINGLIAYRRPEVNLAPTKKQAIKEGEWYQRDGRCKWAESEVIGLCPYGQPGDRLWVRESIRFSDEHQNAYYMADNRGVGNEIYFLLKAQFPKAKSIPSIHMPRYACRIELELIGVRIEELQGISEADALADGGWTYATCPFHKAPEKSFADLWDRINAPRGYGWDKPQHVWVLEFRRVARGTAGRVE